MIDSQDKCFACDKPIKGDQNAYEAYVKSDKQMQYVGSECYKKILLAGQKGYQPPLGGPRLFCFIEWA